MKGRKARLSEHGGGTLASSPQVHLVLQDQSTRGRHGQPLASVSSSAQWERGCASGGDWGYPKARNHTLTQLYQSLNPAGVDRTLLSTPWYPQPQAALAPQPGCRSTPQDDWVPLWAHLWSSQRPVFGGGAPALLRLTPALPLDPCPPQTGPRAPSDSTPPADPLFPPPAPTGTASPADLCLTLAPRPLGCSPALLTKVHGPARLSACTRCPHGLHSFIQ